jgi:hypothetical protein
VTEPGNVTEAEAPLSDCSLVTAQSQAAQAPAAPGPPVTVTAARSAGEADSDVLRPWGGGGFRVGAGSAEVAPLCNPLHAYRVTPSHRLTLVGSASGTPCQRPAQAAAQPPGRATREPPSLARATKPPHATDQGPPRPPD